MQAKNNKPWLNSSGVEISTKKLKKISKRWDEATWSTYLKWYEPASREILLHPDLYNDLADRQSENVFSQFDQNSSEEKRSLCEQLLGTLPQSEAKVLQLKFFEGRTEREIAAQEDLTKTTVHRLKDRGLMRLRAALDEEKWTTRHLMRGAHSDFDENLKSIWAQAPSSPIREAKVYDTSGQQEEFASIKRDSLKKALNDLSDHQKRIIYLRFWCDFSINEIAADLKCGVNLIEQVLAATISKLKRKILEIETENKTEGGPSCA